MLIELRGIIIENWKDVVGFEGYYQVSDLGNVMGLDRQIRRRDGVIYTVTGRVMTLRISEDGYSLVKLSKDDVSRYYPVHRLVAQAFIPNPNNLQEVNHKDYCRNNNIVSNLEWISHGDNVRYSISGGRHFCTRDLRGENNPNYKNKTLGNFYRDHPEEALKLGRPGKQNGRSIPVRLFDANKVHVADFEYIGECAQYLISNGYSHACVNGARDGISSCIKSGKKYVDHYFQKI